jgi:UDP-N-acetylglucosamine 1-carboxyvinyltransferase
MDQICIKGGNVLKGSIDIAGAKNAALPLMTVSLLTNEELRLSNLPHLADISTMSHLLADIGVDISMNGNVLGGHTGRFFSLKSNDVLNTTAAYDLVRKMRASILVLGPLLARCRKARVSLPGGCAIGTRPVDLHLRALSQLGANIELKEGYIEADHISDGHCWWDRKYFNGCCSC